MSLTPEQIAEIGRRNEQERLENLAADKAMATFCHNPPLPTGTCGRCGLCRRVGRIENFVLYKHDANGNSVWVRESGNMYCIDCRISMGVETDERCARISYYGKPEYRQQENPAQ